MTTSKIFKIVSNVTDKLKSLFSRKGKSFTPSLLENSQLFIQPKFNGGMRRLAEDEMRQIGAGPGYRL